MLLHHSQNSCIWCNDSIQCKGTMVHSVANWIHSGEKPTSYFLGLERRNGNRKAIVRLKNMYGNLVIGSKNIMSEQLTFYSHLYTTNWREANDTYLNTLQHPTADLNDKIAMNRVLDMYKISQTIKQLKINKSLGMDRLPIEIYQAYNDKLCPILYDLYMYALEENKLHLSARCGIITLLAKMGKGPLLLQNWCPLSLLNVDYKILLKLIANRMQKSMSYLIKTDQSGFVKGRFI